MQRTCILVVYGRKARDIDWGARASEVEVDYRFARSHGIIGDRAHRRTEDSIACTSQSKVTSTHYCIRRRGAIICSRAVQHTRAFHVHTKYAQRFQDEGHFHKHTVSTRDSGVDNQNAVFTALNSGTRHPTTMPPIVHLVRHGQVPALPFASDGQHSRHFRQNRTSIRLFETSWTRS